MSDALLAEMLTIEPRTGVVDKESHVVRAPLSCACVMYAVMVHACVLVGLPL